MVLRSAAATRTPSDAATGTATGTGAAVGTLTARPGGSDPGADGGPPASVEIHGLSFGYPRSGHRLDDVSLVVHQTEVCCLLGPNGAGKTTLLRCLLGLLHPHHGTVRIAGQDITDLSPRELARQVAYVPQSTSTPFPFTALDIAVMGRTPHIGLLESPSPADRRGALEQLDRLGIAHLADRSFSLLSGGERQLVLLARALVQQASILILDEPTAALDYGNEVRTLHVVAELARSGRSVIMTTHQPSHALTYSNRAVLMRDGRVIADGHPDDVVTGEGLSDLYGIPVHVATVDLPARLGGRQVRTCVPIPAATAVPDVAPSTTPGGSAQTADRDPDGPAAPAVPPAPETGV